MKVNRKDTPARIGYPSGPIPRNVIIRLLHIPFLVYLVWILEIFLFEGNVHLFLRPDPSGLLLYTFVTCILVGLVVPVVLMRRAFMSGTVNMLQFGFRSLRRTILAAVLTGLIVCAAVALRNPFGSDRSAFAAAFLLLLPTGIASVMICWVLVGTHAQALVRNGGALVSISAGVVVTAILFGLTSLVQFPGAGSQDTLFWYISAGIIAAIFFFSVRDVWAASVAVTGILVYLVAGRFDTARLHQVFPFITLSAVITSVVLVIVHWYLSRNYVTIPVPAA
jgi:hypothetical protein